MIDLKGLIGGGGGLGLRIVSVSSGTIASGVTGDILTINAPANSVIRLKLLNCAATANQSGISLTIDGNLILDQISLGNNGPPNDAFVSVRSAGMIVSVPAIINNYVGVIYEPQGKTITVNKNTGNTSQSILYAYEILEPIV